MVYVPDGSGKAGVCIMEPQLAIGQNYFEVEVINVGLGKDTLRIGLATIDHRLDCHIGEEGSSIGFCINEGNVFFNGESSPLKLCRNGDRVGVGIKLEEAMEEGIGEKCPVFFTLNGKEIMKKVIPIPARGMCPAVSMCAAGQIVRCKARSDWTSQEEEMVIDSCEDDWGRLHDVTVHGQVLAYAGRGKTIADVGLAQAHKPLSPTKHYFELEIVDPGKNCYIAIGLAKKDYPKKRHPGWNFGSIAYHADDGKIFKGSGVGDPFGPRCHKGDIMGCGIMFPRDYKMDSSDEADSDDDDSAIVKEWQDRGPFNRFNQIEHRLAHDNFDVGIYDFPDDDEYEEYLSDEDELEEYIDKVQAGTKVQVFFTRNGTTIGRRDVQIPAGGFYPTVGMLSLDEKVRVDLRPLSG